MERLLCILSSMNPGGAETFLMKVYRKLDKSHYQMDFCINVKEKCFYEDEIVSYGGRVFRIPSKSENRKAFSKQLFTLVKKNQYVNVLRITSNAAGFLDLKIAKSAGAKHTIARSSNASDGKGFKQWLAHRFGRILWMKYVDTMIAPSDLAAKYTFGKRQYEMGRVVHLNNGLDLDYYKFDRESREDIRRFFHIPPGSTVIGHVGRFSEQKNHVFLIDVFFEYQKIDRNSYLFLVGGGELENLLKTKIHSLGLEEKVIFAGVRTDIPRCLSAMDLFVFPSLYEGMPNTVIEAQACGLKCLVSSTVTQEVNIGGNVRFLPLKFPKKWAEEAYMHGKTRVRPTMEEFDINTVCTDFISVCFCGKQVEHED